MRTSNLLVWCSTLACTEAAAAPQPSSLRRRGHESVDAQVQRQEPAAAAFTNAIAGCKPECTAQFPPGTSYGWQKARATATITAVTIASLYFPNGTVNVKTLPAKIPKDCNVPLTNAAGTLIAPLTVDRGPYGTLTTTLTYPTAFTDYPLSYWWSGVIPTETAGRAICSEASKQQQVVFESHPPVDSIDHSSNLSFPKEYLNGSNINGSGFVFGSATVQLLNFYEHAFPHENGFQACEGFRPLINVNIVATETVLATVTSSIPFMPRAKEQGSLTNGLRAPTPIADDLFTALPTEAAVDTHHPGVALEQHDDDLDTPIILPDSPLPPPSPVSPIALPPAPTSTTISIANTAVPFSIIIPKIPSAAAPGVPAPLPTVVIAGQSASPGQAILINDTPVIISSNPSGEIFAATPDQFPILLNKPAGTSLESQDQDSHIFNNPGSGGGSGGGSDGGSGGSGGSGAHNGLGSAGPGAGLHPALLASSTDNNDGNGAVGTGPEMPIPLPKGNGVLTPQAAGLYVIAGKTLSAGGAPITLGSGASATTLSLAAAPGGTQVLEVNGVKSTVKPDGGSGGMIGLGSTRATAKGVAATTKTTSAPSGAGSVRSGGAGVAAVIGWVAVVLGVWSCPSW